MKTQMPRTATLSATLSMASLVMLLLMSAAPVAHANETCADIFQSKYEGLLTNPAAKAYTISKLRNTLPGGVYNVRMALQGAQPSNQTLANQTLGISYSGTDGSMLVRLGSTYLLQGSPLSPATRIQLLPNQNIVVSGQVRIGEYQSYNGESVREARIEFSEKQDGTIVLLVSEATKNRSTYRNSPTESQTNFALEIIR